FIAINPDFLKYAGNVKDIIEHVNHLKENPVHTLSEDDINENIMIYREIKKKLSLTDYPFKEVVAKSYIQIMLCNYFHRYANSNERTSEKQPHSRREELFVKFIKMVKEHYLTDRAITFYADKLCVSPKYLSSIVHQVSGKYATEWINQYVILEAKSMLRMEAVAIKDVSNHLNFANQSFFAKFFKQHTGYTPKEYKAL
ncbi:MAG: helix-turn-helix domain-containing protein, partial [Bacteroidales bacterium]|nr:helix-turn-helix domain-containing protein [Bacteroidales bacterium]